MKTYACPRAVSLWAAFIAVLTSFAPCAPAQKSEINLGARHAGDLVTLQPDTWTELNRFVYLMTADYENDLVLQFQPLALYPELSRSCRQWRDTTFDALRQLAARLSTGETRRHLMELKRAVDNYATDPKGMEVAFGKAYLALKQDLSESAALSKRVADNLGTLNKLIELSFPQYQRAVFNTRRPVGESKTRVLDVKAALGAMNGQWGAISTDLELLHKKVKTKFATSDPLLRDLYVNFGLDTWERLEASAKQFSGNVPEQLKNLSGDYYYDLTTVREGVRYVIQSKAQETSWINGFDVVLDTSTVARDLADPLYKPHESSARTIQLGLEFARKWGLKDNMVRLRLGYRPKEPASSSAASNARKEWYFVKKGGGLWDIVSADRGPHEVLSIINNGDSPADRNNKGLPYFPIMVDSILAAGSGQLWRIVCDTPYDCRIYNALLGESRRLEYRRSFLGVGVRSNNSGRIPMDACVMGRTDNHSPAQDWEILVPGRDHLRP